MRHFNLFLILALTVVLVLGACAPSQTPAATPETTSTEEKPATPQWSAQSEGLAGDRILFVTYSVGLQKTSPCSENRQAFI